MRIVCEKGFYKFFPQNVAEIARFQRNYSKDLILAQVEDYFTFPILAALPNYSFAGQFYSGILPALVNYSAKREQVLAENGYAFYQKTQNLILKSLIFEKANHFESNYIFSDSLPQAYSYDSIGKIESFYGFVDVDIMKFKIERFLYASF